MERGGTEVMEDESAARSGTGDATSGLVLVRPGSWRERGRRRGAPQRRRKLVADSLGQSKGATVPSSQVMAARVSAAVVAGQGTTSTVASLVERYTLWRLAIVKSVQKLAALCRQAFSNYYVQRFFLLVEQFMLLSGYGSLSLLTLVLKVFLRLAHWAKRLVFSQVAPEIRQFLHSEKRTTEESHSKALTIR